MKNTNNLEEVISNVCFGVLAMKDNQPALVKEDNVLGKPVLALDGLADEGLMKAYWKLDGNAFDDQPAPVFMKLDTLVLGGCPIVMMLPKDKVEVALIAELEADGLEYVPIAFMDLHKINDGTFAVSGLGISKAYQGMGLSKYMIYAGVKIAGVKQLYIPTQLSNAPAHFAWLHLAPLEIVAADVFHNEQDSVVYKVTVPECVENILKPLNNVVNCCDYVSLGNLDTAKAILASHRPGHSETKGVVGYKLAEGDEPAYLVLQHQSTGEGE